MHSGRMFLLLGLALVYCIYILRHTDPLNITPLLKGRLTFSWLKKRLFLLVPGALLLSGLLYWFRPDLFFRLPLEKPKVWMTVMIAYPVISVLPQEFIFRVFLFKRYQRYLGTGWFMIFFSGFMFGWAHIFFWELDRCCSDHHRRYPLCS